MRQRRTLAVHNSGYTSTAFAGFSPEHAAWFGSAAFITSPNLQNIPPGPGLGNGTEIVKTYLDYAWYTLQLILNDGNGSLVGNDPIDYPYVAAVVNSWDGTTQRINEFMYWAWKALSVSASLVPKGPTTECASRCRTFRELLALLKENPAFRSAGSTGGCDL
jgi:hypothetical protein